MQLGVIGLGTMGANLARNAARNGAGVVVYNRTTETMKSFVSDHASEGDITGCETYEEMMNALEAPRAILLMVKAGPAVDAVIADLVEHLDEGDIIIDGGNSHFADSHRRADELSERGIRFIGMGVSGGEVGALEGPSMMPGGDRSAYDTIEPLLSQMAADDGEGGKCVTYVGQGGAGHFVKMVHNGIEYGIMQLIAESYDFLKSLGGFTNEELAETFTSWNESRVLDSFLIEITSKIFTKKDDDGESYLIDSILDAAGQKGTGKWTTQAALDLGVAIPTINASVDARIISGSLDKRRLRADLPKEIDEHDPVPPKNKLRSQMRNALKQSVICAYNQGFELMEKANEEYDWKLNFAEIARIWRGGCIIRSRLLEKIQQEYSNPDAGREAILERFEGERQLDWRRIVELGVSRGIGMPAMYASLSYYDSYTRRRLPQNLTQAQRDYFGAHTFKRIDKDGVFHAEWPS